MNNTIETVAKSAKSSCCASHAIGHRPTKTSARMFQRFVTHQSIMMLAVCLTVWFAAATAQAQSLLSHDTAQAPTTITTGWWSLESAASASSPHFSLSVAGLPNSQDFDSLKTSTAQSGGNRPADPTDNYILNLTNGGSLASASFLSLLQARYAQWESSLADTRTPTSVNGVMVYPLLQINYANGSLPVALYMSPLRGSSDTRW